ncbi:unnamed protein product [Gordionus sp. m RMFG-2023]|uniref:uncharacterized protein LOC135922583 isoform X3 n=1 Tax=Gordionus sp. m RMFG-2023 TaxID=3053472 RepID=UPI0030DE9DE0
MEHDPLCIDEINLSEFSGQSSHLSEAADSDQESKSWDVLINDMNTTDEKLKKLDLEYEKAIHTLNTKQSIRFNSNTTLQPPPISQASSSQPLIVAPVSTTINNVKPSLPNLGIPIWNHQISLTSADSCPSESPIVQNDIASRDQELNTPITQDTSLSKANATTVQKPPDMSSSIAQTINDPYQSDTNRNNLLPIYVVKFDNIPTPVPERLPHRNMEISAGDFLFGLSGNSNLNTQFLSVEKISDGQRGIVPKSHLQPVPTNLLADYFKLCNLLYLSSNSFVCPSSATDKALFKGSPRGYREERDGDIDNEPTVRALDSREEYNSEHASEGNVDVYDDCLIDSLIALISKSYLTTNSDILVPHPTFLTVDKRLKKSILVSWCKPKQLPEKALQGYQIIVDGVVKCVTKRDQRTRALIEDIDFYKTHRISIISVIPVGHSHDAFCTITIGRDATSTPTRIRAIEITKCGCIIVWLASDTNMHHTIFVNNIQVKTLKPGILYYRLKGLSPSTPYRVKVRASSLHKINPYRSSSADATLFEFRSINEAAIEFKTLPGKMPKPPTNLVIEPGPQDGAFLLSWNPVPLETELQFKFDLQDDAECAIEGYKVYFDGIKVAEIQTPLGDHIVLGMETFLQNDIPTFITVRSVSGDLQSRDSLPAKFLERPEPQITINESTLETYSNREEEMEKYQMPPCAISYSFDTSSCGISIDEENLMRDKFLREYKKFENKNQSQLRSDSENDAKYCNQNYTKTSASKYSQSCISSVPFNVGGGDGHVNTQLSQRNACHIHKTSLPYNNGTPAYAPTLKNDPRYYNYGRNEAPCYKSINTFVSGPMKARSIEKNGSTRRGSDNILMPFNKLDILRPAVSPLTFNVSETFPLPLTRRRSLTTCNNVFYDYNPPTYDPYYNFPPFQVQYPEINRYERPFYPQNVALAYEKIDMTGDPRRYNSTLPRNFGSSGPVSSFTRYPRQQFMERRRDDYLLNINGGNRQRVNEYDNYDSLKDNELETIQNYPPRFDVEKDRANEATSTYSRTNSKANHFDRRRADINPDKKVPVWVRALFSYNPSTMSPNDPEAAKEELSFLNGQLIRVLSALDPDGFFWGSTDPMFPISSISSASSNQDDHFNPASLNQEERELIGKIVGLVPINMVSSPLNPAELGQAISYVPFYPDIKVSLPVSVDVSQIKQHKPSYPGSKRNNISNRKMSSSHDRDHDLNLEEVNASKNSKNKATKKTDEASFKQRSKNSEYPPFRSVKGRTSQNASQPLAVTDKNKFFQTRHIQEGVIKRNIEGETRLPDDRPLTSEAVPSSLSPLKSKRMIALYDYDPKVLSPNVDADLEISFKIGDIIIVEGDMDPDGFYMGSLGGVKGYVPSNFLKELPPLPEDDPELLEMQPKMNQKRTK